MPSSSESDESGEVREDAHARNRSASKSHRSPEPRSDQADVKDTGARASRWDPAEESEEPDLAHEDSEPPAKRSRWADDDAEDAANISGSGAALDDRSFGLLAKDAAVTGEGDAEGVATEEALLRGEEEAVPAAPRLDMLQGCRAKDKTFDIIKEVGSGTYGLVTKARAKDTDKVHALKKIKLTPVFTAEGFPMTSVREINLLLSLQHANIVDVTEVVAQGKDIYMVMEFVQQDLKNFLEKYKTRLKIGEVKRIVHQLLDGIAYLHENWVLHRDLKPANILYDAFGNIKICDFGLARHFGDPVPHMTPTVVTRNYRSPEICMGTTNYTPALDVWSIGVIAAELLTGKVPFIESKSDIDLVNAIGRVIGSPHGQWQGLERLPRYHKLDITKGVPSTLRQKLNVQAEGSLPLALDTAVSQQGYDFIASLLQWDPARRATAEEAMQHPWFDEMPRKTEACFMPQTNEHLRRKYA